MTKPKPKPMSAVSAASGALAQESAKRQGGLKPIEIVKIAICAYQAHVHAPEQPGRNANALPESQNRIRLRRGTQSSVDRLLFNANYWLAAYEDRIVNACLAGATDRPGAAIDPIPLLNAVTVWKSHTLRLNALGQDDVVATFERFCPPFAANNRKGDSDGPIMRFESAVREAEREHLACADALKHVAADMRAEANAYGALAKSRPLDVFFNILPTWCLQDNIALVTGDWWDNADVMGVIAKALKERFLEMGYGEAPCQYFHESMLEAIDSYSRDIEASPSPLSALAIPELLPLIHNAREAHPDFETDGYGQALPEWLVAKEQLIWNTLACSVYGPSVARPLPVRNPSQIAYAISPNEVGADVITELAKRSFTRYSADRASGHVERRYQSFADQPSDLRRSGIEHIRSIPAKLEVLGLEIVPESNCYQDQKVTAFSPSETECLAILEHRRWLNERSDAGWSYGDARDVDAKTSPCLIPWEDLPDRAREWNRSAIRNIPHLLAQQGLAIVRKRP